MNQDDYDPGMSEHSRRAFLTGQAAAAGVEELQQAVGESVLGPRDEPVPRVGDTVRLETFAMACLWQIMLPPCTTAELMAASDVLDRVHDLELMMTTYRQEGLVAQINAADTDAPIAIPSELMDLMDLALSLSRRTEGRFHPAAGALIDLWREARRDERIPTDEEVAAAVKRSTIEGIELDRDRGTIRKPVGVKLNLGAIGKGYALDRLAGWLREAGLESFLVHGGYSSVYAAGRSGTADGWPVALRDARRTDYTVGTVLLKDRGLSSSGSTAQYYRVAGRRFGHLLDPRSGWPSDGTLSVTTTSTSAAVADALSSAFFVGGLDFSRRYCDTSDQSTAADVDDVAALIVPQSRSRETDAVPIGGFAETFWRSVRSAETRPSAKVPG